MVSLTNGRTASPSMRGNTTFLPTERDALRVAKVEREIDRAVGQGPGPSYDSVVICGAGFTATLMAARLARSAQFHGKVVLAGPRTVESRRVKDGLTLRGYGTDYISYALDVPQNEYVAALYGDIIDGRGIGTRNLWAQAKKGRDGKYEFARVFAWQGGLHAGYSRPLFYGARNSRMQGAMHELMDRSGVIEVPDKVGSLEEAFDLAPGKRPLIVNAGHNQRLLGADVPKVDWATIAVQAPLRIKPSGMRYIGTNSAMLAPVVRGKTMDVVLFNAYADPLSPRSSFYGIIVVEVYPERPGFNQQKETDILIDELYGIADTMGLELDDPDETLFHGLIPGSPWRAPASNPGTLELQMIAHPGVSATFSDGMTSGAIGAVTAAEAVLRGVDPDAATRRALRVMNRDRRMWNLTRTKIARPADLALRTIGGAATFYPHGLHVAKTWASAG